MNLASYRAVDVAQRMERTQGTVVEFPHGAPCARTKGDRVLGLYYFKVPTLPRDSQWTGTTSQPLAEVPGGTGSGELLRSGQGADDLDIFKSPSPGF